MPNFYCEGAGLVSKERDYWTRHTGFYDLESETGLSDCSLRDALKLMVG